MSKKSVRAWGIVVLLILVSFYTSASASVRRITAETDSGLIFTVWTDKSEIAHGENMIFHYTIKNIGSRSVYMVFERQPSIYVDSFIIEIAQPTAFQGEGKLFDFIYSEIRPKATLEQTITIPLRTYEKKKLWNINFGFLYVWDKTGLEKNNKQFRDEFSLIGELAQRGFTVNVGTIKVFVR